MVYIAQYPGGVGWRMVDKDYGLAYNGSKYVCAKRQRIFWGKGTGKNTYSFALYFFMEVNR